MQGVDNRTRTITQGMYVAALVAFLATMTALALSDPRQAPHAWLLFYLTAHALLYAQLFCLWPRQAAFPDRLPILVGTAILLRLLFLVLAAHGDAVLLCLDLAVVISLALLLQHRHRPLRYLALYAWNPLVLVHGLGDGQVDLLLNLWIALALLAFDSQRAGRGWLAMGMAWLTRAGAVVLAPFLVEQRNLRWLPLLGLPLLLLPVLHVDWLPNFSLASSLDLLPRLLHWLAPPGPQAFLLLAILAIGLGVIWLIRQDSRDHSLFLAWAWLIVCLPGLQPWHLLPLLLLMVLSPSRAWLLLCATVGFHVLKQPESGAPAWLWWAIHLPFLALLLHDYLRRDRPWLHRYPAPTQLDIVIPVLNEAAHLPASLASIRAAIEASAWQRVRLIIVDGGSEDDTVQLARAAGCEVLTSTAPGRGNQLADGIDHGDGDCVLMLHADALLATDALARLRADCARHPAMAWGILGHRYEQRTWRLRLVELSNRLRFNLTGIAFGDQGIFVRREALDAVGGMPRQALMEDVEISLRLGPAMHSLRLGASTTVSARRWERHGLSRDLLRVFTLVSTYLLLRRCGMPLAKLADTMRRWYYPQRVAGR